MSDGNDGPGTAARPAPAMSSEPEAGPPAASPGTRASPPAPPVPSRARPRHTKPAPPAQPSPHRGPQSPEAAPPAPGPSSEPGAAPPVPSRARPGRDGRDQPRTIRELRLAREGRRKAATKTLDNPLREGLRLERVPDPCALVLFGATGDLAHRKVLPALYQLWRTHLLPHEFMILAFGRREYSDDAYRNEIRASLDKYSRVLPVDEAAWAQFAQRICYQRGDFNDPHAFEALTGRLDTIDTEQATRGNRLFYLATQPSAFPEIIGELGRAGLDHEHHIGGWRRIIIEKPFGRDLDS
ncbi:MAG TPA: hypothetical protein VIV06_01495, partial [Candidatus Limnocylindrales bacterium]